MKDYSLYEIVRKLNGGSILPVGETNYDDDAYKRMLEQESLISELINDIEHVKVYVMKQGKKVIMRDMNKGLKMHGNVQEE